MRLSEIGTRLASPSGLRSIMEDVASSTLGGEGEWLNLSVGNPAAIPKASQMWQEALRDAIADDFDQAGGHYGPSRGSAVLVDAIASYFNHEYGWNLTAENIVVGPGSQMVCFAAAALFTGPSSARDQKLVLPMVPDYTGYQGLCMHDGGIAGIEPGIELESAHRFRYMLDLAALSRYPDIGMLLISSPGNPTGRAITQEELDGLIGVAEARDVPLFIDHAYGAPFPRIADVHMDPVLHPHVVNCFSASKAGLPGERVGFAIGDPHYIGAIASFMSNSVLHAPQLPQAAVASVMRSGRLGEVTRQAISPYYRRTKELTEELLAELLPEDLKWRTHSGRGGMFSWAWIDHPWFDDIELYRRLKEKHVFVVPGRHFFVDARSIALANGHATRCFRLSLSAPEKTLLEGVRHLADTLAEMRAAAGKPLD
jgi:valine--pyruvate aminotransferase